MIKNEDFKDFYAKYYKFSIRIAYRIVKDYGVAEDIGQDVFYNLYKLGSKLELDNERKLRSLVETATVNKAKDYLKKAYKKREVADLDNAVCTNTVDKRYNVEAAMLRMEKEKYMRLVLQRLREENEMNYEILVKVKLMDIPPEDVAKEYGITRNNVNNRIHRTRLWIEAELSKLYKD